MDNKPTIFISHITEEAPLAELVKAHLLKDFLGLLNVFVSSDRTSISLGDRWLEELDRALQDAKVMLVLCSEYSVPRPWINFEAGAGWLKRIPVVPICHTGIRPVALPVPLNMLQAMRVEREDDWRGLYQIIAKTLSSYVPEVDLTVIVGEVRAFEQEYGLLRVVRAAVKAMISVLPELEYLFLANPASTRATGILPERELGQLRPHLDAMKQKGMLDYSVAPKGLAFGESSQGFIWELTIQVEDAYYQLAPQIEVVTRVTLQPARDQQLVGANDWDWILDLPVAGTLLQQLVAARTLPAALLDIRQSNWESLDPMLTWRQLAEAADVPVADVARAIRRLFEPSPGNEPATTESP